MSHLGGLKSEGSKYYKTQRKTLANHSFTRVYNFSGEGGIRTPGTSQYNGFQDRRNRPLCHLSKTPLSEVLSVESGAKVRIIFKSANNLIFFSRINRIFADH